LQTTTNTVGWAARSYGSVSVARRSGIVGAGVYGLGMATFAVRVVHGPSWDSRREIREQRGWDSHAAFMDALVDDGFVILGGPVGYDHGALHLVESADEQDVRARRGKDPWVESGVLLVGSVEPWLIWLDGRSKASAG
jgi:uncharacterized protein YciI